MSAKLLFIVGIVPSDSDSHAVNLAERLYSHNIQCDIFSPALPAPERIHHEYEHLEVFNRMFKTLRTPLMDTDEYSAIVCVDADAVNFYYSEIKGMSDSPIILFDEEHLPEESKADALCGSISDILSQIEEGASSEAPLTSIIMLTFNQLPLTKDTLDSLEEHTSLPYELIIVDNGSEDGTVDFLKKYSGKKENVKCIYNPENLAFSKANNQGMRIARGEYILLLNNDVILTDGWLKKLLRCMESSEHTGAVGPCTNIASGPQKVNPGYSSLEGLSNYAAAFSLKHAGRWVDCHRLNAFCFLIRRSVIEQVGMLDERFGPGGFEDYDYCLRIRQGGFKIMLAGDTYVHHIGGQGYEPNKLNYNDLRYVNKHIFIEKWCKRAFEIMENLPDG